MACLCRFFANFFQFLGGSDNTTYTFTMPAQNVTVSATFEVDVKAFAVTAGEEISGGSLQFGTDKNTVTSASLDAVAADTTVYVKPTAEDGYKFKENSIKVNGTITATATSDADGVYEFTMPGQAAVVTAEFESLTKEIPASHTGNSKWGGNSSGEQAGVDLAKQRISTLSRNCGNAYIQIDGLNELSNIGEAILVADILQGGNTTKRDMNIYYLADETDINSLTTDADYTGNKGDVVATYSLTKAKGAGNEVHEAKIDVTNAILAAKAANKDTAIFMISGNAAGGYLIGKGYNEENDLACF